MGARSGGLLATAAIYQLDRTNTRATDPLQSARHGADRRAAQPRHRTRAGAQHHAAAGWYRPATRWQKAEITKTTAAAPAGREVPLVPRHSFSLWNRYDVTKQLRRWASA